MKFLPAPDNENYKMRLLSTCGRWEMGFIPRIYTRGVGFSPIDADGPTVQYDGGENWSEQVELLLVIREILEKYPANVTEKQLHQDFPETAVRPVFKDAKCWARLQEMAEKESVI